MPLYGYPEGTEYYMSMGAGMSFNDSREYCQSYGGDLASIANE